MLPESVLAEMYPVIMTPNRDGKYFHDYILSLLNIVHANASLDLLLQVMMQRGESLIMRARNNCMAKSLENKEWTYSSWIDSDIGFSPDSFYRLLLADKGVVAGVYPLKRENWPQADLPAGTTQADFERMYTSYTVNTNDKNKNGEITPRVDEESFMKVHDAPTGFVVIKRSVFEKMIEVYPELNYVSDSDYSPENKGLHYRFFDCMANPESERYLSEDYTSCYLWRQIDGEVYVDVQSNLTHQGAKVYHGSFAESLRTNVANAIYALEGTAVRLELVTPLHANPRGPE